jgi:hypothetical protein
MFLQVSRFLSCEGETEMKCFWYETPLNAAMNKKAWRLRRMMEDRRWSVQEYEDLCRRDDAVITILKREGGELAAKEVVKTPFDFDSNSLGRGRMRRALREGNPVT